MRKPYLAIMATVFLGYGIAGVCRANPQDAAPPPAKDESFPFYMSTTRMLVMMRIKGGIPAPVVFDTGTNGNMLDTVFAETMHVPHTGASQSIDGSTGNAVPGYQTTLSAVSLGGVAIADGAATVTDFPRTDEVGVFGPNSFPGRLVMIDFDARRIRILAPDSIRAPKGAGFPYRDGLPSVPVDLPGLHVDAKLDSGNDSSILLPLALAGQVKLKSALKVIGYATSAAGRQPVYEAWADGDVRVGEVDLVNPVLRFMAGGTVNIGLPVMARMKVVLDPALGMTWVEPCSDCGPARPTASSNIKN